MGVAADATGNIFVADANNNRVRGATGLAGLISSRESTCASPAASPVARGAPSSSPLGSPGPRAANFVGGLRMPASAAPLPGHVAGVPATPVRATSGGPAVSQAPKPAIATPAARPAHQQANAPAPKPVAPGATVDVGRKASTVAEATAGLPPVTWLVSIAVLPIGILLARRRRKLDQ